MTSHDLPPVDIAVCSDGERRRIRLDHLRSDHSVRDLLPLFPEFGVARSEMLAIDGVVVPAATPLTRVLRHGSTIGLANGVTSSVEVRRGLVRALWTTGPDAGRAVICGIGRYVLGSATDVALFSGDPSLARHQGVVTIDAVGKVWYEDLGIGRPALVDGVPTSGTVELAIGAELAVGSSTLTVIRHDDVSALPSQGTLHEDVAGGTMRSSSQWVLPCVRTPHAPVLVNEAVAMPGLDASPASSAGVSSVGLITAGVSVAGGGLLAFLLKQPVMILMVAIGAVGSLVTFAYQALGSRQDRRRRFASNEREQAEFGQRVAAAHEAARELARRAIQLGDAVQCAENGKIWSAEGLTMCLGIGDVPWSPTLLAADGRSLTDAGAPISVECAATLDRHSTLHAVPVTMRIQAGQLIEVAGHEARSEALIRSLLVQLAVSQGPSQWRLTIVAGARQDDWQPWAGWLPHAAATGDSESLIVNAFDASTRQRLSGGRAGAATSGDSALLDVIVVAAGNDLVHRTSELRRYVSANSTRCVLIVMADHAGTLSTACSDRIEVGQNESVWSRRTEHQPAIRFRMAGASVALAHGVSRSLARWSDPELIDDNRGITSNVDALALFGVRASTPGHIVNGWAAAGVNPPPVALIGVAADGPVEIDLDRDGPHALVAGTTGSGKSELLRTLITGLALTASPEHLQLLLVDYKGGSAFDACASMPHVAGVVTDLDDRLAERVLRSLNAELVRRERLLRQTGAENLVSYRSAGGTLARLVIVVDEFASLAAELSDFIPSIVDIARRGRSLGVHLVLATQRPAGVVNDDIRANMNLRIALRLQDASDSVDVVGTDEAAGLPRGRPGRAVLRFGADELVEVQIARSTGMFVDDNGGRQPRARRVGLADSLSSHHGRGGATAVDEAVGTSASGMAEALDQAPLSTTALQVLVERIRRAAKLSSSAPPARPWLPALPSSLSAAQCEASSMGLLDEPDTQTQRPLSWAPSNGHLVVVGALASGTSSALAAVATGLAARQTPDLLHLYLVDQTNSLASIDRLPHCGARVSLTDPDRVSRLLDLLSDEIDRRQSAATTCPVDNLAKIIVLIDGGAALRQLLGDHANLEGAERFELIASVGPQVGVVLVVAGDQPSAIPASVLSRADERWVLSINDPFEASLLGVEPRRALVGAPAGRGIAATSGCEFQLVSPDAIGQRVEAIVERSESDSFASPQTGPRPLRSLPAVVFATDLSPGFRSQDCAAPAADDDVNLVVGLDVRRLQSRGLMMAVGDHALIAGPARSGRTNLLALMIRQFVAQRPNGWVGVVAGRRPGALATVAADYAGPLADVIDAMPSDREILLAVDDADVVDDLTGQLAAMLTTSMVGGEYRQVRVIAAGRTDGLRASYGHWTSIIRRQRRGVLLGSTHDLDADLFSAMLPRRTTGASVPGRGWLIQQGVVEAVQVGLIESAAA